MASFGDLPTEVAQKCVEFLQQLAPIARTWSAYWRDRVKARSFVVEARRIQHEHQGRYEAEWGPLFDQFYEYA